MKTIIAVICNGDVVDKVLFDEPTEQGAVDMAKSFLQAGHFEYCNADDVLQLPDDYVIGDYCKKGKFVKAKYYAQLDEGDIVTSVERRAANAKSLRKKEAEVDRGRVEICVGLKYVDGLFVSPEPQEE